eukprot:g3779.t1
MTTTECATRAAAAAAWLAVLAACIALLLDRRSIAEQLARYERLADRHASRNFEWVKDTGSAPLLKPSHEDADLSPLRRAWADHLRETTPRRWLTGPQEPTQNIDCAVDVVVPHNELAEEKWHDGVALGRAVDRLHECGVVYLDNLFSRGFVDALREYYYDFTLTDDATKFRYPCQGAGRIEHMMPFAPPFNSSATSPFGDRRLREIISKFLGPPFKLELVTVINSRRGSRDQRWHQGWRYLFHEAERLPPYAVVVTVPLDDVSIAMGGTQFCPRKKMRFYHGWRCDDEYVQAETTKGTVIVFDYKLLHRGPGNAGERDRPMVSMVFSKSFFFNSEAYVNRGISNEASLHQRRYLEQWFWHPEEEKEFFKV